MNSFAFVVHAIWTLVFVKYLNRPGINFTNILQVTFAREDPKSAKRQSSHQYLFDFLESFLVKAVR